MPKSKARVPSDDELRRITTRAVAEIVPHQEFVDGLRAPPPGGLRIKMGFDPTKPLITLGWAVGLRKLRQIQDLGHTVVVIIGDWTARIGDPSGESQTRKMLTAEDVRANSEAILRQFYTVLDESRTEIRWQSEWFDPFTLTDVVRLAARTTVAQVLQRDDFAQRYAERKPIGLHELMYPLLQAYDSVAVEADVEFGGTDQKFNNLMGRELQRALGQRAGPAGEGQAVFLVPLLVGLDGSQKMSQSLDNFIAVDDPPHDMYGKLMSIPDTLIGDYFDLLTDVPDEDVARIRKSVDAGGAQAMDQKMRLAREIVAQFHSESAAQEAEEKFEVTYRIRVPKDASQELAFDIVPVPEGTVDVSIDFDGEPQRLESLVRILIAGHAAPSASEARRLIQQGAVHEIGWVEKGGHLYRPARKPLDRDNVTVRPGSIIRVGKHRFLRIVDAG